MPLPKGLGTVEDLNRRIKSAEERWNLWRSLHQEAYDYSMPDRETFRFHSKGQNKNRHVFDSTAIDGVDQFAARIQGGLFPPWQQWMDFEAGTEIPENEKDQIDQSLKRITNIFFNHINQSNFSTELEVALKDLAVGTGAIMVEEVPFGEDKVLHFSNVPLAELYPETPPGSVVESAWRKQEVEVRHIKRLWPEAELPNDLQNALKNDPTKKVCLWNGMLFNPEDKLYWQVVFYQNKKHVLFQQSFKRKRLIVFRWSVTPGEVFGRGPIIKMLPDIRTLNKADEFILQNAALQIAGVYTGVNDGVFNPYTVRIAPGSVIPVSSNAPQNPSLAPLTPSGNLQLGELLMEQRRESVRKALFSDPLGDITDPVRTATEMLIRNQEMLRTSGAQISRQKPELMEPVVAAVVEILQSRGLIPEFRVDGQEVAIKPTSPLAKAEMLEEFQNTQVWMSTLQSFMPFEAIAGSVKIEDLPKKTQEQLDVDPDLVRTEEERRQLAETAVEASQQLGGQDAV
jgi:hypothetical protein